MCGLWHWYSRSSTFSRLVALVLGKTHVTSRQNAHPTSLATADYTRGCNGNERLMANYSRFGWFSGFISLFLVHIQSVLPVHPAGLHHLFVVSCTGSRQVGTIQFIREPHRAGARFAE